MLVIEVIWKVFGEVNIENSRSILYAKILVDETFQVAQYVKKHANFAGEYAVLSKEEVKLPLMLHGAVAHSLNIDFNKIDWEKI